MTLSALQRGNAKVDGWQFKCVGVEVRRRTEEREVWGSVNKGRRETFFNLKCSIGSS